MFNMRLEVMQYFLEIADAQSVTRVSKRYSIPQQSLSSMMVSLENELGSSLFIRSGKGLALTEEGKLFYQYCQSFFLEYTALKKSLNPENEKAFKKIIVSAQNNIAQTLLPNWMSSLLKYQPEIEIEIKTQDMRKTIEDVLQEKAQIGFILRFEKGDIVYPKVPEEIRFQPIFFSRPYFWVNQKSPLAQYKTLHMKMLEDYTIIREQNSDNELFDFIFAKFFKVQPCLLNAVNVHIIAQLVKDNIAICSDLKTQKGELGLEYLFTQQDSVVALPLSMRDTYKLVTGYIVRKDLEEDDGLISMLKYL